jgi:hypothetical protein
MTDYFSQLENIQHQTIEQLTDLYALEVQGAMYDPQDISRLQGLVNVNSPGDPLWKWKHDLMDQIRDYDRDQCLWARRKSIIATWAISVVAAWAVFECVVAYFLP